MNEQLYAGIYCMAVVYLFSFLLSQASCFHFAKISLTMNTIHSVAGMWGKVNSLPNTSQTKS